ncbi:acyltransferase [Loigolactobacillus coryniformis subsp. coryniformis]|nr:acyltransferase family protein [Loigolactobacillus coryniformis]ATO54384.1 acyltransferase [Loigolactobacillus coryniformis subsp. coryniformis KCTC 3167 = DSM 20001]OEH90867.1 acyltransferase [Loigolactobacillus coryniformis subsp. coryniformis]
MSGKRRIAWIDIAKAIGIIAVVVGHAYPEHDTFYNVLYWWHMPLFFMIGGFFLRPLQVGQFKTFAQHKLVPLLREYFGFGLFLTLVSAWVTPEKRQGLAQGLSDLLYGGTHLNGVLSAFWYMTVYLLAVTLLTVIISFVPQNWLRWLIITVAFLVGTAYSNAGDLFGFALPGDADVTLCALFYMYAGRELFRYQRQRLRSNWWLSVIVALSSAGIMAQQLGVIDLHLYMKSHEITSQSLALILPLILCSAIFMLAYWLQFTPFVNGLTFVGKHTMIIMYLHKLVFAIFERLAGGSWLLLAIAGLMIPIMVMVSFERLKESRQRLFWLTPRLQ